ncbi:PEPxxWA-CTERM sorting domain-containing protein [Sandarakinorhabdus sp. DWP1-3-1]|uniref:Npun_F0296 family exosortase-dependent surface protein n=1 Tax=Sandarakinorhabdus sp. DWP1-3-1 TaxID=2804627 RepID=UPI003CF8F0ED
MRVKILPVIAAALAATMAMPAAAVTVSTVFGAPDPGAPGQTLLVDFEGDLPDGYTLSGDYGLQTGSNGSAAAPAGNDTQYLFVSSAIPNGSATLSTLDLTAVSFYWGSIDSYNSVDILLSNGSMFTIAGDALPPANGNQDLPSTNRRVFFTAEGDELISGIRFNSTGVAFEVDDVYGVLSEGGAGATVPEPASWAMLIAGFGLVGAAARRRRMAVVSA